MREIILEPGDGVCCDICNEDYTNRPDSGGIVFGSRGVCPACTPELEAEIAKYGEAQYIKGRCPPDKSFADWIRDDIRGAEKESASEKQAQIIVRDIITEHATAMVSEIATAGIPLSYLVIDLANYGNYVIASQMHDDGLSEEKIRELCIERVNKIIDEVFNNAAKDIL